MNERLLVSLFDFENQGLFPGVDSRFKFCLLTLSTEVRPVEAEASFMFFAHSTADLTDDTRAFGLSLADFALINPNTRTCPVFRSSRDAALVRQVYRSVPVLSRDGDPDDPWEFSSLIMFMMNTASSLFVSPDDMNDMDNVVPLIEGKSVHQFNDRYAASTDEGVVTGEQLIDPDFRPSVRYHLPRSAVSEQLADRWDRGWLWGWRSIARATDERTLISALVPESATSNTFLLGLSERLKRNWCRRSSPSSTASPLTTSSGRSWGARTCDSTSCVNFPSQALACFAAPALGAPNPRSPSGSILGCLS